MPILECKQLSKSYGKAPALENVSFAIEPGRIVGLLGPNGSGKTTLIKLANGLLTPDSGEILIDGAVPGRETHAVVSYLPEDYILTTIISNYNPEASVILSTHLIADVEKVLDEVVFIDKGHLVLQSSVDQIREEKGMSVDALFREVFKC